MLLLLGAYSFCLDSFCIVSNVFVFPSHTRVDGACDSSNMCPGLLPLTLSPHCSGIHFSHSLLIHFSLAWYINRFLCIVVVSFNQYSSQRNTQAGYDITADKLL